MPETHLKVRLITCTPQPDQIAALAARVCYSSEDNEEIERFVNSNDQEAFLNGIMASGHLSVLEHATFTFAVEGVSRVLLAQLTRHRIASFSVQSQRYVSMENFGYIIPPSIRELGDEAVKEYSHQMEVMRDWYIGWQEKLGGKGGRSNEDARFVLPGACETRLVLSMNARELLHFFQLRCCNRAQWEIRELAEEMLSLAYKAAPALFRNAGPSCVRGACTEGRRSCGRALETQERIRRIKER